MTPFKKILALLVVLLALGLLILKTRTAPNRAPQSALEQKPQTSSVQITSTSPSPLDGAVIPPSQTLDITFSAPVQNKDEFKSTIDPKVDYSVSLSGDRKTVTITPSKPFGFSQGYTLHISSQTKFDGDKHMDSDKDFHFQTINYSGA